MPGKNAPASHEALAPHAFGIQQYGDETGTRVCNRRYRACLRSLVPTLGESAIQTCQTRRDTCLDALGEGFFYRGGTR